MALLLALTGSLAAQEGDAGETAEARKLKDRSAAPSAADIDPAVNLQALLSRTEKNAFSEAKGATVEGWVVSRGRALSSQTRDGVVTRRVPSSGA